MKFDLPTLMTLTGPTCSGKSYLLEELVKTGICERIVSTTTRAPRKGEVQGVHYDFITQEESVKMEAAGEFAELVTFNGVRYGVTNVQMEIAIETGKTPIVILEPNGVEMYKVYCNVRGWKTFHIYVHTNEFTRLNRLDERAFQDGKEAYLTGGEEAVKKVIKVHGARLSAFYNEERLWHSKQKWDAVVPGTDAENAMLLIKAGIFNRNNRNDIYR